MRIVHPEYQRRGIGRLLLETAKELSPKRVGYILSNKAGWAFYEKNDFKAAKLGISPPPENEPGVLFEYVVA